MYAFAEVPPAQAGPDRVAAWRTAEERQAAARHTYRTARQCGEVLTGAELAAQFGMSERWGRDRVAEVRAESPDGNDHADGVTTGSPTAPADDGSRSNGTDLPVADTGNGSAGRNGNRHAADLAAEPPTNGNGNGNGNGKNLTRPAAGGKRNGNRSAAAAMDGGNGTPTSGDGVADHTGPSPAAVAGVRERSWLDLAIILAVASVAAAASYGHMLKVALIAGEPLFIARAFPVMVDGLVLAALRCGERGRHWLELGIAISVGANVLAQFPDVATNVGPFISAWPPIALYGTHKLLQNHKGARRTTGSRR